MIALFTWRLHQYHSWLLRWHWGINDVILKDVQKSNGNMPQQDMIKLEPPAGFIAHTFLTVFDDFVYKEFFSYSVYAVTYNIHD